jgi:hypothetical protein
VIRIFVATGRYQISEGMRVWLAKLATQAAEVVPSSVTFSKPQAVGKVRSFVSRAMVEDLGVPAERFRQNVEPCLWPGRAP